MCRFKLNSAVFHHMRPTDLRRMNQLVTLFYLLFLATCCYGAGWSSWGPCEGGWSKSTLKIGRWTRTKMRWCTGASESSGAGTGSGTGGGAGGGAGGAFTPSGGQPQNAAEQACLDKHNEYRRLHGKPPLQWDGGIQASAQKWADHIARSGRLQHTPRGSGHRYGENLAMSSRSSDAGAVAVERWYNEICHYNTCGWSGKTGHFTQVVWAGSKYLGCAVAKGRRGYYTVAQYSPAGNMVMKGWFQKNVGCPWDASIKRNKDKTCR